ncbi:MAG: hypothetical protein E7596_02600 [Ruminococcaceae bacterium]|nr:hypothetical protein [Oscillospiraceae bacterium]
MNGESVVAFPEDSTKGYLKELESFHCGIVMLAEYCYKKGIDVPIYVTYFKKDALQYVIDAPVMYSALAATCQTREEMANVLLERCNRLGRMEFDKDGGRLDTTAQVDAIA